MKKIISLLFILGSLSSLYAQVRAKTYTNTQFGWSIMLPDGFENVDAAVWQKLKSNGVEALDETYNGDVDKATNINKTLLVLIKGDSNYFEVNWQPHALSQYPDYEKENKALVEVLAETFKQQVQGTRVKSAISKEMIGTKEFLTIKMEVYFPNNIIFYSVMYRRLFGAEELAVNIMYIDTAAGKSMLDAFKKSIFK